ncbi:MAG TPA: hypothetical protein VGB70_02730 [Allosphingosinicella sp.]|jgi:hypothetical protein
MIDVRRAIIEALPRDLLLDLEDRIAAEAMKSFEVVRDHLTLNAKRSREAVGQIRFRAQEQGFEEVVLKHGGIVITDEAMPGTELKIFQPFARFQGPRIGVILGFASMPEPRKKPPRNQSRGAGVTANLFLQPELDLGGPAPRATDIFVLFLVARDRQRAGMIEEVAVGVIGADYEDFLFYESLDAFLSDYGAPSPSPVPVAGDGGAAIKLRTRRPYVPPEQQQRPDEAEDSAAE